MAKNKKSFILYSDQRELFNQLTDEQAGKLIKFIYSYVNDERPTTEDAFINLAFTPIKQSLKRDLKKWEQQQKQRVNAGKKSAEVRKRNATTVNERSISSTVNVSVNDNVNVNDNVSNTHQFETDEYKKQLWDYIKEFATKHKLNPIKVKDTAINAYDYYKELGWKNSKGKEILNLKNTIRINWFKDLDEFRVKEYTTGQKLMGKC